MQRRTGAFAAGVPFAVLGLLVWGPAAQARVAEPAYEMPFPCKQEWTGSTRSTHTPSTKAIDFNRTNDVDDYVVASAPGVVSKAADLGSKSYGRYVVIEHATGRTTLYAHLNSIWVSQGQLVDQGAVIGQVGSTGNSSGPHLHYEQRVDSTVAAAKFHGTAYVFGTAQQSANCVQVPVAGDWDGDGTAEVGTFKRVAKSRFVAPGVAPQRFGKNTDDPVVGDWDGNGTTDRGVRRGKNGRFLLARPDGTKMRIAYGAIGDRPVSGDWDGDGKDEIGVYRSSTGQFWLRSTAGTSTTITFGSPSTYPVTGDWNGDQRTDLGTFDPSTATWTLRYLDRDGIAWVASVVHGRPGDLPVTGDWDSDGRTNLGTWTRATATASLRSTPTLRSVSRERG